MQVLDHGSVELVDSMVSDQTVLRSMLVSTGQDRRDTFNYLTQKPPAKIVFNGDINDEEFDKVIAKNVGRINYLMREKHGTPFEHNAFTFRVCAPIFVLREWHRHRIGWSYNEQSGRYMELGDKWYIPSEVRKRVGKPGHYTYEPMDHTHTSMFQENLGRRCYEAYNSYKNALDMGVAPEQARLFLHVNHYSSMYTTCNARSLMAFLELRAAPTAQWEIQQYANALELNFAELMPVTYEAFVANGRIAP